MDNDVMDEDEDLDVLERPCDDCGRSDVRMAPMLMDASWRRLAHKRELLCGDCLNALARQRGVKITLADLRPCAFNGFAGWFEEFADQAEPEVVATWLKWARRVQERDDARREQARRLAERATDAQLANPRSAVSRAMRKIFRRGGG